MLNLLSIFKIVTNSMTAEGLGKSSKAMILEILTTFYNILDSKIINFGIYTVEVRRFGRLKVQRFFIENVTGK